MPAFLLNRPVTALVGRARQTLGMTQEKFGEALGASKRTASRWDAGRGSPSPSMMCRLAALVHPRDPSLAAELAASASETLESLGIVQAPPAVPPAPAYPTSLVVDAVVCAAADALSVAPETVRGALLAAFRRARELRLSIDDVEKALGPAPAEAVTARRRSAARPAP